MDEPKKTSPLPSVRTFARDAAKKQAATKATQTSTVSKDETVAVPEKKKVAEAEKQIYQAPKEVAKPTAYKQDPDTPTLKPISAPKSTNETIVVKTSEPESAMILRESKKDRFRLFPAIFDSIKNWYAGVQAKRLASKSPKYSVPDANLRKGVIQKATSKTGKVTSADYSSIHERIRQRKERAVPKQPLTIWTANTEPGYPLLPGATSKISNVQVIPKKTSVAEITPKPPVVEKREAPLPPPVPVPKPAPVTPIEVPKPVEVVAPPAPVPEIAPEEPEITQTIEVEAPLETETVPGINSSQVTLLTPKNIRDWLFSMNTNTISVWATGVCVLLIIFGLVSYVWLSDDTPTEIAVAPALPILTSIPLTTIYPSELEAPSLFATVVQNYSDEESEVTQVTFVADPSGAPILDPEIVLSTLGFSLDGSFTQTISSLYFGSIGKKSPFIILEINDQNTARGGMLAWEEELYEDVSPLFVFAQSVDRSILKTALYADTIISGNDVRVLRTLSGTELLTYGIINRSTIIITNTTKNLETLITLLP